MRGLGFWFCVGFRLDVTIGGPEPENAKGSRSLGPAPIHSQSIIRVILRATNIYIVKSYPTANEVGRQYKSCSHNVTGAFKGRWAIESHMSYIFPSIRLTIPYSTLLCSPLYDPPCKEFRLLLI